MTENEKQNQTGQTKSTGVSDIQVSSLVDAESTDLADNTNLINNLKFSPSEGRIWFDTHPLILIRSASLSLLHWELNKGLGHQEAGSILARLGYESGVREALLARKMFPDAGLEEMFRVGPKLRKLRGLISIKTLHQELDLDKGHFYNEAVFSGDFEVDTRIVEGGMPSSPVCWNEIAYASGFASTVLGQPVIYKEVECSATGAHKCRMVGKYLEMWYADEIRSELKYLPGALFAGQAPAQRKRHTQGERCVLPGEDTSNSLFGDLIGTSSGLASVCEMLQKVAGTSAPVLLLGETGVGKEMIARTLHQNSKRSEKPFVAVNCAAIPDELIEAELFGVVRGAFTGATHSRPGRFERAQGGTLFLDEVGNLTKSAQAKLLRAVQEKEIERVGDTFMRSIDVRIISATNEDLQKAVDSGDFRDDLLFRLNVFPIKIPPLRERREDISLLMAYFLERYTVRYNKQIPGFTDFVIETLYQYDFPGNIRELENLIERTVILADDHQLIDLSHLFGMEALISSAGLSGCAHSHGDEHDSGAQTLYSDILDMMLTQNISFKLLEHRILKKALGKANENISKAAGIVGLSRPQMAYRLKKFEEDPDY